MDPYELGPEGLRSLLADQPAYRAAQVHDWLLRGVDQPREMTNLPKALRARLAEAFAPVGVLRHSTADSGLTHKLLLGLGGGGEESESVAVEVVVMRYPATAASAGRATVCISTQAGCAMGCVFCATGQVGLRRNLRFGEIVRQVTAARRLLSDRGTAGGPDGAPDHVTNVVFMGMGEPLANLGPTVAAVRWLADPAGFGLSARSITVSTVGLVPGIRRLTQLGLPLTLAVSLHAPNDELRDQLVPINRTYPLAQLVDAAEAYRAATGRRLTYEYVLIGGVNDRSTHAAELAGLVRRSAAHVNLIPYNPTPGVPWRAPAPADQQAFLRVLADRGVNATIRRNRGRQIDAACGQLYADYALGSGRRLPVAVEAPASVPVTQPVTSATATRR